jgi:hypothetical protein
MANCAAGPAAHYADLKDSKIMIPTTPYGRKVLEFHPNLKKSSGDKLNELQVRESLHNLSDAVWKC